MEKIIRDISMYAGSRNRRHGAHACHRERPKAVIADLDGSLVNTANIVHHALAKRFDDFHAASADCPPNPDVVEWTRRHHYKGHVILVVTGRMQKWHQLPRDWLNTHVDVPVLGPFMRADGDKRPGHQVKREIFHRLSQQWRILAACDDDPKIVDLWNELNLTVFEVPGYNEHALGGDPMKEPS